MITLHSLRAASRRTKSKRLGRGNSSGKGTTAGRGTKGQRARSGGRNKLTRRGLKALVERTPKTRGFRSRRHKSETVSIAELERVFDSGTLITPETMRDAGLIQHVKTGVKILGKGELKKKLTVKADSFSKGAREAITKAGGTATLTKPSTK